MIRIEEHILKTRMLIAFDSIEDVVLALKTMKDARLLPDGMLFLPPGQASSDIFPQQGYIGFIRP